MGVVVSGGLAVRGVLLLLGVRLLLEVLGLEVWRRLVQGLVRGVGVERRGLHPDRREWVSYGEHGLWGRALLDRDGHHDRGGAGGWHVAVHLHLLQVRRRPGAVFRGQHHFLLLLLVVEVSGSCRGRQWDLTDLTALRAHRGEG